MSGDSEINEILETIREGKHLLEMKLVNLLRRLKDILYQESNVLELPVPIIICGDIHGQLFDLFNLFDKVKSCVGGSEPTFLFMGDYVDRGYYSIETFAYLAALKVSHPNKYLLLRGNHESRQTNILYGFYDDSIHIYGHAGIWQLCNEIFDLLPIAAIVDNQFFCVHGGLSKDIKLVEQLDLLQRRVDLPPQGALSDLCWSDPEENIHEWTANKRGAGYLFGKPQVLEFLHLNSLKMVTRSHQLAMEGYQYFFDKQLITVWSAPNYMYRAGNKATVMKVDEYCNYELIGFEAHKDSLKNKPEELLSTYFS